MHWRNVSTSLVTTMVAGALLVPGSHGPRPWSQSRITSYGGTQLVTAVPDFGTYTETRRGVLQIRGQIRELWDQCDDERATGFNTVVINANLNSQNAGRIWGTYELHTIVEGGWWEGRWTGRIYADGTQTFSGRGYGRGEFEGSLGFFSVYYPPEADGLPGIEGEIEGRIIDIRRREPRRRRDRDDGNDER